MGLSRQQRRALQRQKDKEVKKIINERINTLEQTGQKQEIINMARWVQSLSKQEAEYCNTICQEHTKEHIEKFSMAWQELIENFLIEEGYDSEKIITEMIEDLGETGMKLYDFENKGESYFMKLNKDRENILNDYDKAIEAGKGPAETLKDIIMKYNKYSKGSIKNIIRTGRKISKVNPVEEGNCASFTCPNRQKDGNCGNDVVTSGRNTCQNYNPGAEQETVVVEKTKKQLCFEYFDENKNLTKEELIKNAAEKFGVKESSAEIYQRAWRKERFINKDFEEAVNEMVVSNKETDKESEKKDMGKFKVTKKVVQLDLEGQYGQYHIEDKTVSINGNVFTSAEQVKESYKNVKEQREKELEGTRELYRQAMEELRKNFEEKINAAKDLVEKVDAEENEVIEVVTMAQKGDF